MLYYQVNRPSCSFWNVWIWLLIVAVPSYPRTEAPASLLQKPQTSYRMLLSMKVRITTFVVYSFIVITISRTSATVSETEIGGKGRSVNITAQKLFWVKSKCKVATWQLHWWLHCQTGIYTNYPTKEVQVPAPVWNLDNVMCVCVCVWGLWKAHHTLMWEGRSYCWMNMA